MEMTSPVHSVRRMRFLIGLLVLLCFLGSAAPTRAEEKEQNNKEEKATVEFHRTGRAFIPDQRCSFIVTKGWRMERDGNSTVMHIPGEKGSQANIIITSWQTDFTPERIAREAAEKVEPKGYKVEKPEPFSTFSKIDGLRVVATASDKKRVGVQFIFPAGENRILTLTGTFDQTVNVNFEQALNLSMKTLHLLDRAPNLPAELGTRFGDKRATIRVPLGWDARADIRGANAFSPPVILHSEQMFVNFDRSNLPLEQYAAAESETGEKPETFVTEAGVKGLKIRGTLNAPDGKEVRTVTYCFDGLDGMKVVVGASAEATLWPAIESLFDLCGKSVRIGPEPEAPKTEAPKTEAI